MEQLTSKAERTRQFIIEATAGIFNKKGFAGTSMSDLTDATGLTKGATYGNFESKEEVASAVFDYNLSKVRDEVKRRMSEVKTYRDKLMVYAIVYDHYTMRSFPDGGCPILNTSVDAYDTNPLLRDRTAKAVNNWQETIQGLVRSGIEVGEFIKDTDESQLASSIVALIEGGELISRVTNDRTALHRVKKTVAQLIDVIVRK